MTGKLCTEEPLPPSIAKVASLDAHELWQDSMIAGDDKLNASDMKAGVRLLTNGSPMNDAASAWEPSPPRGTPAMFDDQPQEARNRRQSLHTNLLSPLEISQVSLSCIKLPICLLTFRHSAEIEVWKHCRF